MESNADEEKKVFGSPSVKKEIDEKFLSIDDGIERLGMGMFQTRIVFAAGLCFAADAMEVMLLSFLSVVLRSVWDLTDNQASWITSSVFAGAFLGTLVLGSLADTIGRKPVFIITVSMIALFGVLTAAANTYIELLVARFIVGFGVGGLTVPYDILAEFTPNSHRGPTMLSLKYFWTLGTTLVPIIAYFTLGKGAQQVGVEPGEEHQDDESWRMFVLLCAIPCILSVMLAIFFVPESPRFLVTKNNNEKAIDVLRLAAKQNKKDSDRLFPKGIKLFDNTPEEARMGVVDLFSEKWRFTTITMWIVWISFALLYYGTILMITRIFSSSITLSAVKDAEEIDIISLDENDMYNFDYAAICFSALSEFIGIGCVIMFIDKVGRIPMQRFSFAFSGFFISMLCMLARGGTTSRDVLLLFAFLARMFASCAAAVTWLSTAEILPTEIRTTGHSAANAVARIGAVMAPFITSESQSFGFVAIVLLLVGIIASLSSSFLPETAHKPLGFMHKDVHQERDV